MDIAVVGEGEMLRLLISWPMRDGKFVFLCAYSLLCTLYIKSNNNNISVSYSSIYYILTIFSFSFYLETRCRSDHSNQVSTIVFIVCSFTEIPKGPHSMQLRYAMFMTLKVNHSRLYIKKNIRVDSSKFIVF